MEQLPVFKVTKKRDGLLVHYVRTGQIDYLDWWEGWLYRLTKRLPDRFFRWHDEWLSEGWQSND